jgi:acetyltransferase-like isoleucine patch superfamily enzyme
LVGRPLTRFGNLAASAVVIYGTGSPIVVDVEESLSRAGLSVLAAVQNMECKSWVLDRTKLISLVDLTDEIRAQPFLVPLFTPANRQRAALQAVESGFEDPFCLIDPTVAKPGSLECERGVYVNAGCTLGGAAKLGEFGFVNRGATIGHHARLGRFVSLGPGAILASFVAVGDGSVIGAGAVVLPKVTIGSNAVVGAGAVVTEDVPNNCLVLGNPARIVKRDIAGYGEKSVD